MTRSRRSSRGQTRCATVPSVAISVNETPTSQSSQSGLGTATAAAGAALVGGVPASVRLLRRSPRVGEEIEEHAEGDSDPARAMDPAGAPDDRVHQGCPRQEDQAEDGPPRVCERILDAMAED